MNLSLTTHRDLHPFAQGIHHGHTNAMQAAGHLVATSSKLAAGMQHGEHRLQGTLACAWMHIGRNAAAVIGHRSRAVSTQHHNDAIAMPCEGLVHRVIHHLVHQVVQTTGSGGADVHARAFPDGLKPLQHLNLFSAVFVLDLGSVAHSEALKSGNWVLWGRNGSEPRSDILNFTPGVYSVLQRPLKRYLQSASTPISLRRCPHNHS